MLAVLVLVSACQPSDGLEPDVSDASTPLTGETAIVTWVNDGDTFQAETDTGDIDVRIIGINAPEQDECLYKETTDHLIGLLQGQEVLLEPAGIDQFGRTLAHVFVAEMHINAELVESGMAIATTPEESDRYGADLLAAEEEAWRERTGLWAVDACGPSSPLPELAISVNPDPSGPDDEALDAETVTIINRGSQPVNLTGWVLRDESSRHRYRFGNGVRITSDQELVISSNDPGWIPGDSPVWNNDGDMALLLDKHGRVVARERY